jgi:hypothetical protein
LYTLVGEEQRDAAYRSIESLDLQNADDLFDRFSGENTFERASSLFFYELGACPGSKVGGELSWENSGRRWEHLLTLSSREWSAASYCRWLSVEDRRRVTASPHSFSFPDLMRALTRPVREGDSFTPLLEPSGMSLGRTQRFHIYLCREGEEWPVWAYIGE